MVPFTWLLLGHLAGDFLFQNRLMAENKQKKWLILILHSIVYTFFIFLFSIPFGGLSVTSVFIIILTHIILDDKRIINWWTKYITNTNEKYLTIIVDQTFHLLILALILHT